MPDQSHFIVQNNRSIARDVFQMDLTMGDTTAFSRPGQFVDIRLDGHYLRRPMSVCHYDEDELTLIYKVVGKGTRQMALMGPGQGLDLLVGLGNGFDVTPALGRRIALIAGGVGLPPLYGLMEALEGEDVLCAMGFASAKDVFYEQKMADLGARVLVATEDGTRGVQGTIIEALADIPFDYYFACGPQPMLRAAHALGLEKGAEGQLSFEARMGCGFGACMGCTCRTKSGPKRVCVEGPVFSSREVKFS